MTYFLEATNLSANSLTWEQLFLFETPVTGTTKALEGICSNICDFKLFFVNQNPFENVTKTRALSLDKNIHTYTILHILVIHRIPEVATG